MSWPTITDYQEVIQNPHLCFADPELQQGSPLLDPLGLPKPITGGFASVYQMICNGRKYAIRCFLRYNPDQKQRYAKISSYLQQVDLPYMVVFKFLTQGIKVRGQWYPILKMDWIDGEPLNSYVEKNLKNPKVIRDLAQKFVKLIFDLERSKIAHGDLQHGNILIANGDFRLIDYDGMYVPDLKDC
jgi:predicted Ser/Thr protein kinase